MRVEAPLMSRWLAVHIVTIHLVFGGATMRLDPCPKCGFESAAPMGEVPDTSDPKAVAVWALNKMLQLSPGDPVRVSDLAELVAACAYHVDMRHLRALLVATAQRSEIVMGELTSTVQDAVAELPRTPEEWAGE